MAIGVVVLLVVASVAAPTSAAEIEPVDRVLIITLPEVAWADLAAADLPALDAFIAEAGLANLATRIGRKPATLADAYLTMGAGRAPRQRIPARCSRSTSSTATRPRGRCSRAVSGGNPRATSYTSTSRRCGGRTRTPTTTPTPGALGDVLAESDVERSVIANADLGVDLDPHAPLPAPGGNGADGIGR